MFIFGQESFYSKIEFTVKLNDFAWNYEEYLFSYEKLTLGEVGQFKVKIILVESEKVNWFKENKDTIAIELKQN